jgi:hypothetical protein
MQTAATYLKQLEQAKACYVDCQVIDLLKDCYEMAAAIELADKQPLEADGMTIVKAAAAEMRSRHNA